MRMSCAFADRPPSHSSRNVASAGKSWRSSSPTVGSSAPRSSVGQHHGVSAALEQLERERQRHEVDAQHEQRRRGGTAPKRHADTGSRSVARTSERATSR